MQMNDERPWCLETDAGDIFFWLLMMKLKTINVKNSLDSNLK